jgi:hypothetical protein
MAASPTRPAFAHLSDAVNHLSRFLSLRDLSSLSQTCRCVYRRLGADLAVWRRAAQHALARGSRLKPARRALAKFPFLHLALVRHRLRNDLAVVVDFVPRAADFTEMCQDIAASSKLFSVEFPFGGLEDAMLDQLCRAVKQSACVVEIGLGASPASNVQLLLTCPSLRSIELQRCLSADFRAVAHELGRNEALEFLSLKRCLVTDEACVLLTQAVQDQHSLRVLNLDKNFVGEKGFQAVMDLLRRSTAVEEVSLSGNADVTPPSMQELARALSRRIL